MSFIDLNLKCSYSSAEDNLVEDFYNPILSKTKHYDRTSGYFSSTSLAIAAKGIKNFILNNGKMRLLCGVQLSEEDLNSALNSVEIANTISESFLEDIETMEDEIQRNHVKMLAWMLANDYLEIKIGVRKENDEYVGGILHTKTGIVYDDDNNCITFDGSNNETAYGWVQNIEKFKVFCSWNETKDYIYDDINEFNQFWSNENESLEVIDIPKAAKNGLIKIAPKSFEEMNELTLTKRKNTKQDKRKLYPHQKEAIEKWFENGNRGILEMATGTGKTFTAIEAIEKLLKEYISNKKPLLIVIAVPTSHLIEQWENDLSKRDFDTIIKFYSNNSNRKEELKKVKRRLNTGMYKNAVVIVTHKSASTDFFIDTLEECSADSLFVADEVHGIGSSTNSKALQSFYNYRLGLSATPSRWFDDEGDELINYFFGEIIFSFDLDAALREGFLTPYEYHPIFVELTKEEYNDYLEISRQIIYAYSKNKEEKNKDKIETLLFRRQRILNKAKNKYKALEELIIKLKSEGDELKNLIIFCTDTEQLNKVKDILDNLNLKKRSFTGKEPIPERERIITDFKNGIIDVILAMKCLDEGVDVPSTETAIILASTSNPREYIQRRGRVLRKHKGKEIAHIYDMIIDPNSIRGVNSKLNDNAIYNIYEKESLRYREFASSATNDLECINLLYDKFG